MRSLGMRNSLLASAGVALLIAMIIGAVGIQRTNAIADRAEAIYQEALRPLGTIKDVQQLIWHARWASLSNLTASDPAKAKAYGDEASATYDLVTTRVDEYKAYPLGGEQRASIEAFQATWATYMDLRTQSSALKKAGKIAEWEQFRSSTLNPAIAQAIKDLDSLVALSDATATASAADARAAARQARWTIAAVLALGVLVAAVFALLVAGLLNRRLTDLRHVLSAMADGDLTERTPDTAANEIGEGFAVVAGEVKDLAQETAKATEEISKRTEAIQSDTQVAVEAIAGVGEIIGKINDYQNTIASAVEEQSATTNGMTGDLNRAANGTSEISSQLAEVVEVTEATRNAAQATDAAAADLADISGKLRTMIGAFRY